MFRDTAYPTWGVTHRLALQSTRDGFSPERLLPSRLSLFSAVSCRSSSGIDPEKMASSSTKNGESPLRRLEIALPSMACTKMASAIHAHHGACSRISRALPGCQAALAMPGFRLHVAETKVLKGVIHRSCSRPPYRSEFDASDLSPESLLLYSKSSLSWLRAPSAAGIGPTNGTRAGEQVVSV